MEISQEFLGRMKELLQDEYPVFEHSLEKPFLKSLRLNPKKFPEDKKEHSILKHPSGFAQEAFLVEGSYGNTIGHIQGLYYLQEPSAGGVVEAMHVQPGDQVLDLCAAPGSKTTQIYGKLGADGFLVCNEIMPKRARILLSNLERIGAENFCLCNLDSRTLCEQLPEAFDKILVDAPCSGEGMIKKHEKAIDQWNPELVAACARRQKEILSEAYKALKKDGELVYSTCTYSLEENEEVVSWFLSHFEDMEQIDCEVPFGRRGFEIEGMDAGKVVRIFPMDGGEGHFIARFKKTGGSARSFPVFKNEKLPEAAKKEISAFLDQSFTYFHVEKSKDSKAEKVYAMNVPFIKTKGILRQGLLLGEMIKNRFEPSHAFFLSQSLSALNNEEKMAEVSLKEADELLHGLEIPAQGKDGWVALTYQGIPFGGGKRVQGRIKNKIPKGLRLLPNSHTSDPFAETD